MKAEESLMNRFNAYEIWQAGLPKSCLIKIKTK